MNALLVDSDIHTQGCYVSVSEFPFALRVVKDLSKILWNCGRYSISLYCLYIKITFVYLLYARSLEKFTIKTATGYGFGTSPSITNEFRPAGAQEATIVLWNNSKS